jgi:pimeloyl-ACP methyl ester carboxylesterase
MSLRPLLARVDDARIEQVPLRSGDGLTLGLCRVVRGDAPRPAVLITHGLTASSDMFVLPETRNLVDVLLDAGFEPWLFDWRGSCRLPYNEAGPSYTLDDVALHDVPAAVAAVRAQIGDRKLFVIAQCVGALSFGLAMAAGLVPGLSGVIAQGVFLTPKMALGTRLRMSVLGEIARPFISHIPTDIRKVGLWSKYTPLFALASLGAECSDPTCHMAQSGWGSGGKLFQHDNLHPRTHERLAELLGSAPTFLMPHLRKMELAHALVSWHEGDPRYAPLPQNALDQAHRIDCPLLLLSGSENGLWLDSNKLCAEVLKRRHPQLDARYIEVAGYGHFDAFVGRGAALEFFPHITRWLHERLSAMERSTPAVSGGPDCAYAAL